jgi:hypothetical protein
MEEQRWFKRLRYQGCGMITYCPLDSCRNSNDVEWGDLKAKRCLHLICS